MEKNSYGLEDASHFLQENAAERMVECIEAFLKANS